MQRCSAPERIVPPLTTQQSAELTGRNRTTIWRACKTGRLSATKNDTGEYLIEVAELERAFGRLNSPQPANGLRLDALHPDATSNETSALRREVELLREQVRTLSADKDDLRAERDRLIGVLERNAEHMRLLTDQREQKPRSPSLFSRFFRKNA